eukprot:145956_1
MAFIEALWNYYSATICTLIACVVISIVFIVYTYKNVTNESTSGVTSGNTILQTITNITLFLLIGASTLNTIDYLAEISPKHCELTLMLSFMFFGYYKGFLYIIYVGRLHLIYYDTIFEINRYLFKALVFMAGSYFLIYTFLVTYVIFVEEKYHYIEKYAFCTLNIPFYCLVYFGLMDVIFPLFCLYLFVKPIISFHNIEDITFKRLATKYTIITSFAVVSSILLIIVVAVFGIWIPTPMDYIINCICIILYDSRYKSLYRFLCRHCDLKIQHQENVIQMETAHVACVSSSAGQDSGLASESDATIR